MEHNTFAQPDLRDRIEETKDRTSLDGSRALYAQLDADRGTTPAAAKAASAKDHTVPAGFGIVPPYMLETLALANGDRDGSAGTYEKTLEMQNTRVVRQDLGGFDYHGAREVYDVKGGRNLPGQKARFEGDAPSGNEDADKAYDFTGVVRDFYQKEYGRNSIDGQGMKFLSSVDFGDDYQNAYWNGRQMVYGHPGPDSAFRTLLMLDVCGHEITHGVTENESNFQYYGQSGALNESVSDVFGELIKQYSTNENAEQAHWVVGEGVFKDGVNGRGIRDMLHPGTAYNDKKLGKDPQPDSMDKYIKTSWDNGGVHINSGIPNRAFALFATSVGGHGWDDPGHIWYDARKHSGTNPCFASFAYQTIESARRIAHQPDEVGKLQKAWAAVGVTPSENAKDTDTPPADTQANPQSLALKKAG